MKKILDEFNLTNSTNDKLGVLRKYKDNKLVIRCFQLALDKVKYNYYVTMKNVPAYECNPKISLTEALDILENDLSTRNVTGNAAIDLVFGTLQNLSADDAYVIERILDRDLKINFGKTGFNKIIDKEHKITKPPYERCDIGTAKNVQKNINFNEKVFSEVKMDGEYRSCTIADDIIFMSRSGNEDEFPLIKSEIAELNIPGYTLIGELTLKNCQNRSYGNGQINSDNPPHEDIIYTVWDMIPAYEYSMDKTTQKKYIKSGKATKYEDRLELLEKAFEGKSFDHIKVIDYKIVRSMKEAFEHFQEVTKNGDEGTVIKAHDMVWQDGTSKKQLKVKLIIALEMRATGFQEGKKGTKREQTFGSMTFENDEGTIKGRTSGFTDAQLEDFNSRRDELMGKVFTVICNDITKGKNNEHYALSHPRFDKFRDDKNETDTLERALELKEMAMELK